MLGYSECRTHSRGHFAKRLPEDKFSLQIHGAAQSESESVFSNEVFGTYQRKSGASAYLELIPMKSMLNPRVRVCISEK